MTSTHFVLFGRHLTYPPFLVTALSHSEPTRFTNADIVCLFVKPADSHPVPVGKRFRLQFGDPHCHQHRFIPVNVSLEKGLVNVEAPETGLVCRQIWERSTFAFPTVVRMTAPSRSLPMRSADADKKAPETGLFYGPIWTKKRGPTLNSETGILYKPI